MITLAAGIAVHETLAALSVPADIKWVNDVLVGGRKIAGILGETTDTPQGLAVILGIGINIANSSFPPAIAGRATSLNTYLAEAVTPTQLATPLIADLKRFYAMLLSPNGTAAIIDEWGRRSSYFKGKAVKVMLEGEVIRGVTDGLAPSGALRVITGEGTVRRIQAGQVELLRDVEKVN